MTPTPSESCWWKTIGGCRAAPGHAAAGRPGQFDFAWTSSLRETLERIRREGFDAVLLDLSLPDSHGLETITRLSTAVPAMPILVITGLTDEHIASEAVRCGAEDYLVKGQSDARSIVRAIRYAIDRKRAEEALKAAKDSAERAKAAAEQANRAKDHFLAVLSHELRTPLTPVVMGVSMLQDRPDLDPAMRETLEMVRRNVEMEARLIDDLLDVSRIARGKIELSRSPVELCTVIHRAVEVCKPDIEARQAALRRGPGAGRSLLGRGRRAPAAAGLLEPAEERDQVHAPRRVRGHPLPAGGDARGRRGERQRNRDRGGGPAPDFQRLRAGGAIDHAAVRRSGLGVGDQQGPGGDARGHDRAHSEGRDKGATFRVRLPLTAPAGQPERARARRGPGGAPSAPCASCWSKTTASRRR